MTPEEKEEELILFAVLQDIANELRRIKRKRQETKKEEKQGQIETKVSEYSI